MARRDECLAVVLFIIIFLGSFTLGGDMMTPAKAAKLDEVLTLYHKAGQLNGVVLVGEEGKVTYKQAFGCRNLEKKMANQGDTQFYIYEMTKPFTAVLILQLVEEGKLKLAGNISDYLPYYRKDTGQGVTIHHLLTETHGLRGLNVLELPPTLSCSVREFVVTYLSGDRESGAVGKFKDSGLTGYTLLGACIEAVTGKTYRQVLKERILGPLKMKNSGFIGGHRPHPNRAVPYRQTFFYEAQRLRHFFDFQCNGCSSMAAAAGDLFDFLGALIADRLISKESRESMFKPHVPAWEGHSAGYGWFLKRLKLAGLDTEKAFFVQGGGECSSILYSPDDHVSIVLLNNIGGVDVIGIETAIMRILYGLPVDLPKQSIVKSLLKTFVKDGLAGTLEQYRRLSARHSRSYDFGEGELIQLGRKILTLGKKDEAAAIIKLNLQSYPQSWQTYYNLGRVLIIKGDKEAAVENFRQALELNPRRSREEWGAYIKTQRILAALKRKD
jgi:CubicO group peptidase (beta-lactamase class C family)